MDEKFLLQRTCLLEPLSEIFEAADLLNCAVDAHLAGDSSRAEEFIRRADMPAIAKWSDMIWGRENPAIHRFRTISGAPGSVPKDLRPRPRNPGKEIQRSVISRDGHHCRFCGIPVVRPEVRMMMHRMYPQALRWGDRNSEHHAAFQCMWLQYDHVLPNSRGGRTSLDNLIVTCAPCNNGRNERTLEELGLIDPRASTVIRTHWDGLERVLFARIG
jgi:5-methylcytosine-specific restriction endonuclease McrA